jgi:tetratricopeptide (TPR) repeat protein
VTIKGLFFALYVSLSGTGGLQPATPAAPEDPWVVCRSADQDASCAHLNRARVLLEESNPKEAGREYRHAVEARRASGQYPGEELWLLANFHHQQGEWRQAVRTLDLLAEEAQRAGDLDRLALGLTQAVILDGKNGRKARASARLGRLAPLLESPYLPVERVDYIRERLIGIPAPPASSQ